MAVRPNAAMRGQLTDNRLKRRHILTLGGATVALPGLVRAQPASLPRIGYLSGRSYATDAHLLQAFREGLKSAGYVDGQNVAVDVRWADGRYNQVPAMMAELVASKPNVIAAVGGNPVGLAAKAATSTIPVVFSAGADPVEIGLVGNRRLPAIYPSREFPDDGGLMSYGARWSDMYRIVGSYAGRLLKGDKPADLPVQRPTTYELVINLRTAKSLGLTLPPILLAR